MRRKIITIIISLILTVFIPPVYANPVFYTTHPENIVLMFLVLGVIFMASVSIEIFIIKLFLRKNVLYQNSKLFYKSIIAVNLLTFIFTQIIALFVLVLPQSNLYMFLILWVLIEIIPIIAECLIFLMIYNHLNEIASFRYPVGNKTTLLSTITANLVTFLLGAVILYFFPQII